MKSLAATTKGRRLLFFLLYISEGAPIGFIWWTLPTLMKTAGVDTADIAELSALLVIPWTLKIFWAPAVDVLQFKKWNLRMTIAVCQIIMGLTILPLAFMDLGTQLGWVKIILLVHALFAATQDVAIDAWAIKTTDPSEHGRINGYMQMGMLTGRWIFASGFLLLSSVLSTTLVVFSLASVIWLLVLVVLFNPDPSLTVALPRSFKDRFFDFHKNIWQVFTRKRTWAGLAFAGVAGTGLHATTAVLGPYFMEKGLAETALSHFFTFNLVTLFIGSYLGGIAADRFGHRKSTGYFLVLIAAIAFVISGADHFIKAGDSQLYLLYGLFQLMHFAIGLFTASSYAMLMDLTDKDVSATQYSAYMGAVNACESWTGYSFAAAYRSTSSYAFSFSLFAALSLLGLLILPILRRLKANR